MSGSIVPGSRPATACSQHAAISIGAGERAHPGDVVATRANDRDLRTDAGQMVRNRDLWTVTSTHSDGSLTVSHHRGHGTVTLPVDYARHHVRLGYAATEYGNQSDTVDVAIELVSTATTHRGLYVGATRGRDDNRIHVITDSTDLTEARDVLETVLAYDRGDIPAVTQRRDLARQIPTANPTDTLRAAPPVVIPAWLGPWRTSVHHRRDDLVTYLTDRADRRAQAAAGLVDLQPALAAARAAWQPYAKQVAHIEDELRTALRPAMWKANHLAMHADFGHRHSARRQAKMTNSRVDDANARIAAIHLAAGDVKRHLDVLEAEARNLGDLARPSSVGFGLDDFNRDQLNQIDRLLDAVDVRTTWTDARSVPTTELTRAVAVLTDVARNAPLFTLNPSDIDRSQWLDLLEPVTEMLRQRGVNRPDVRDVPLERTVPELGIEL